MATFKPTLRAQRADGTYLVYIRCTHNRKIEYIKTDMYIISKKVKKGEINDSEVLGRCAIQINEYIKKLNRENIKTWDVKEVVSFLTDTGNNISFTDFCKTFIDAMINEGREKSASNYGCAVKSFESYFGNNVNQAWQNR